MKVQQPSSQHRRQDIIVLNHSLILKVDQLVMECNKCSVCCKDSSLQCKVCKVTFYCGPECKADDHLKHGDYCKTLQKLTGIICREKADFHASPYVERDFSGVIDGNNAETHSHLYMKTRVLLFNMLDDIGTECTLREAVALGKELIKDGRGNYPEVRYMIPCMYLRLSDPNALQQCYDFMKWGDIHAGSYEQEVSKQHCQSDMCESLYSLYQVDLYNLVALTILKMRLLLQIDQFLTEFDLLLRATIRPSSFMHTMGGNQGALLSVTSFLLPNYSCFTSKKIAQLRVLRTTLSTQVQTLLDFAESYNKRIWKILVNPGRLSAVFQSQKSRFPSRVTSRILTAVLCYRPFFDGKSKESRAMRQILIDRVGESPTDQFSSLMQAGTAIFAWFTND